MKTYIKLLFSSEGARPSDVVDRLCMLGFTPVQGHYDLVYEWDRSASVKDAIWFGDKIHAVLQGLDVLYELETV